MLVQYNITCIILRESNTVFRLYDMTLLVEEVLLHLKYIKHHKTLYMVG